MNSFSEGGALSFLIENFRFYSLLGAALGTSVFVAGMEVDLDDERSISLGRWVGGKKPKSRAPYEAYAKAAELFCFKLFSTPNFIEGSGLGVGQQAGVRIGESMVAVAGLSKAHNKLLALLFLSYAQGYHQMSLHHVGLRCVSREEMFSLARFELRRMKALGLTPKGDQYSLPAKDREQVYFPVSSNRIQPNDFYLEVQYFPEGPQDRVWHVDLVVCNPENFLKMIAASFGVSVVLFEASPNDPKGVVWVPDGQGNKIGVMARKHWWSVEEEIYKRREG